MEHIKKIRWLLVDNHGTVAESLPRSVDENGLELEHAHPVALDASEALQRLAQDQIDIVLLDVALTPDASPSHRHESRKHGWKCAADIREKFPKVRVVMISAKEPDPNNPDDQRGLFELGGLENLSGYISKDAKPPTIAKAIRQVMDQGTPYFPLDIYKLLVQTNNNALVSAQKAKEGFEFGDPCARHLTLQLHRAMLGVARGLTNVEIGKQLFISEGAVEKYLKECCERLYLDRHNKQMLAKWAAQNCIELKQQEGQE
jgi:DNA-binding NarL/FixJ family response regulator